MGGKGFENRRQLVLYVGVLLGALAKIAFDHFSGGETAVLTMTIPALIASIVIFPYVYYKGGLDQGDLNFGKWAIAFQSGFFWTAIIELVKT
jgi:hypothetical protein